MKAPTFSKKTRSRKCFQHSVMRMGLGRGPWGAEVAMGLTHRPAEGQVAKGQDLPRALHSVQAGFSWHPPLGSVSPSH